MVLFRGNLWLDDIIWGWREVSWGFFFINIIGVWGRWIGSGILLDYVSNYRKEWWRWNIIDFLLIDVYFNDIFVI